MSLGTTYNTTEQKIICNICNEEYYGDYCEECVCVISQLGKNYKISESNPTNLHNLNLHPVSIIPPRSNLYVYPPVLGLNVPHF